MKLRCRVYKTILLKDKLGNKARNVSRPGALHTPSLRLDFFVLLFVSRQKVVKEKRITSLRYKSMTQHGKFRKDVDVEFGELFLYPVPDAATRTSETTVQRSFDSTTGEHLIRYRAYTQSTRQILIQ